MIYFSIYNANHIYLALALLILYHPLSASMALSGFTNALQLVKINRLAPPRRLAGFL